MRIKKYNFNYQDDHKFVNLSRQSLLQQSIDQVGIDVNFLPKSKQTDTDYDVVFREMSNKTYDSIYSFRCGVVDTSFFENGENSIFTQFGLSIENQIELIVTQKEFWEVINDEEYDFSKGSSSQIDVDYTEEKPEIDDLLYINHWGGRIFRIKTVEDPNTKSAEFNQGMAWFLTCDLWQPSSTDEIDVDEDEFPDTEQEFIDIVNNIDDEVRDSDLTVEDIENAATQTGYDAGSGIQGEDHLNDNYEQKAKDIKSDAFDPFNQW